MKDFFKKCCPTVCFALATGTFFCGCAEHGDEEQALLQARTFAGHYFNFRFNEAYLCCTPESRPWLVWKASSLTAGDMKAASRAAEAAHAETSDFRRRQTNDSCATVRCVVSNVLEADSLEAEGRVLSEAVYVLPLVKRDGHWLIKMEAPLRSEK